MNKIVTDFFATIFTAIRFCFLSMQNIDCLFIYFVGFVYGCNFQLVLLTCENVSV